MTGDAILIENLEIHARAGITEEERAQPQRLALRLTLWPKNGFSGMDDRLENTVDYAAVRETVRNVAAGRARSLIETLAEEMAAALLEQFPLAGLELELRKFVLPDADYAAVRIRRPR